MRTNRRKRGIVPEKILLRRLGIPKLRHTSSEIQPMARTGRPIIDAANDSNGSDFALFVRCCGDTGMLPEAILLAVS
jgi:hypothetical protein